jgi:hypothetical protein
MQTERRRVLVIGHSHAAAIHSASVVAPGRIEAHTILIRGDAAPMLVSKGAALNPRLRQRIVRRRASTDLVALAIGGQVHNVLGLVELPEPIDLVVPELSAMPAKPGRRVIPLGLIEETIRAKLKAAFIAMGKICTLLPVPAVHICSPPPVARDDYFKERSNIFSEKISLHGVAPASVRYKLWWVHSRLVREFCDRSGIAYLPPPKESLDTEGYLAEGFAVDATHANAAYGRLVLGQLESHAFASA